jgi:hypothetical protein
LQIIDTILEARTHESREKFILEAYNAWQIVEVVKGIMSDKAKGTNFADYMKKLGLNEQPKKDAKAERIAAAFREKQKVKALSIAEEIRQADFTAKQGK